MKNTEQILDLIIGNIKAGVIYGNYKSLNESVIMYKETLESHSKYIYSEHYEYLENLITKLSEDLIIQQLNLAENKNARLLLNSVNICESILKNYKNDIIYKEELESGITIMLKNINSNMPFELLNYSINKNILVIVDENHRRIGKTKELVMKAIELDCSLVVKNLHNEKYCKQIANDLYNKDCDIIAGGIESNVRGRRCKNNMFLVDEFVSKRTIDYLIKSGNNLIGGFVNYSKF